jgi:hypothetical protein
MNGETDALKNLHTVKGDVKLSENKEELHKNGVENGKSGPRRSEDFEQTPIWIAVMTYIAYAILILFGYLRDFMRFYGLEKSRASGERGNKVSDVSHMYYIQNNTACSVMFTCCCEFMFMFLFGKYYGYSV